VLAGVAVSVGVRADADTAVGVLAVLDELGAACQERNVERALACFSSSADVVLVGSGVGERADGHEQLRALVAGLLTQFAILWTWDRREVWATDSFAWAMLEGSFHAHGDIDELSGAYRLCVVLERDTAATWRLVLFHGSEPSLTGQARDT